MDRLTRNQSDWRRFEKAAVEHRVLLSAYAGGTWTCPPRTALADTGELLAGRVSHAAQRRAVIKASPELQERERTKFAAVTDALAGALRQRGAAESTADLLAHIGVAIFQTAFERWTGQPEHEGLSACIREVTTELASSLGAVRISYGS